MPASPPDEDRAVRGLSRRTAVGSLVGATVVAVAGCTGAVDRRPKAKPSTTSTPEADPDMALAATVLADEQAMLDLVVATVRRHSELVDILAPTRATHRAHIDLLTEAVPDEQSAEPSAEATTQGGPVQTRPGRALTALARREERLSLVGKRSAFAAESGPFARVLASMAAAASQQAVVLAAEAKDRR